MSFMWAEKINYSHVQSAVENKGINLNNKVKKKKKTVLGNYKAGAENGCNRLF